MRCPACNKYYVHNGKHYHNHLAVCRGTYPSSLVVGGGDPSRPHPVRLVPTIANWLWASTFSVTKGVSRRLPRLYRKIPHALRVEVQRAFSLPLSRIRDVGGDVGAWSVFTMMPCWCLALPPRGGVAGHRVTRQRIARFLQGDWEALHTEHIERCYDSVTTPSRLENHGDDSTASIRRALHLSRSGELSRAALALIPVPLAPRDDTTVAALHKLHPAAPGPLPSFVEGFEPLHAFVLDRDCFVRALHTSPSHSSSGIFGGVLEHY